MSNLHIDQKSNTLIIVYKGHIDRQKAEKMYLRLKEIISKAKKGFVLLADMSFLERIDIEASRFIDKMMDLLNKSGVRKIIRIIPDQKKDIGFNIMSLFHYSSGVSTHTFKTYEEAKEHLK